jgi:hypothetical protein
MNTHYDADVNGGLNMIAFDGAAQSPLGGRLEARPCL